MNEGDYIRATAEAYRREFQERARRAARGEAERDRIRQKAGNFTRSANVSALLRLVDDVDVDNRALVDVVEEHLVQLGDKAAEELLAACTDRSWSLPCRRLAVLVLRRIGGPEAGVRLRALVGDVSDDGLLRAYAIETLSFLTRADSSFLNGLLYDRDTHVRWHAAKALIRLGGGEATKLLLHAACSKEPDIRGDILEAIGSYGRLVKDALPLIFESRDVLGYEEGTCVGIGAVLRYSHPEWWGRAEEEIENATQRFPACAYARFLLGDLWMTKACNSHSDGRREESQQLHEKALGALWKAVAIDPTMPDSHYTMAESPWLPYDEVVRHYQRALALDNGRSRSFAWNHWSIAMKASEAGQPTFAVAAFVRAMLLLPDTFLRCPTNVRPSSGTALTYWTRARDVVAGLGEDESALARAWAGSPDGAEPRV